MQRPKPSIGYAASFSHYLSQTLEDCRSAQMDFCILPLTHPRLERTNHGLGSTASRASLLALPLTRSDMLLESNQWQRVIVGRISRWLSFDESRSRGPPLHEQALEEEFAWAAHLGLPAVYLPPMPDNSEDIGDYARAINHVLVKYSQLNAWQEVALGGGDKAWRQWNQLRTMCEFTSTLHCALVVPPDLPIEDDAQWDLLLRRWLGEPLRAAVLPADVFISNPSGFPALGAKHRALFETLYLHKVQFVLSGKPRHANGLSAYQMYLTHLGTRAPLLSEREEYETPYFDYLQSPLQPLGDNLSSGTYEVFEQDPVKYLRYQLAMEQALVKIPDVATSDRPLVIMVLGAGRGPLVRAALKAAERVQLTSRVLVYVVEKNPNAIITLLNAHKQLNWGPRVSIVASDMREWKAPQLADIVVSELLGSWGDNELSPECLGGVERFLRPTSGVSIPQKYTSYVAPVQTPKLYSSLRNMAKSQTDFSDAVSASFDKKLFETTYVCRLFAFFQIAPPQPCFTFEHQPRDVPLENREYERFTKLQFVAESEAVLHGFIGYFDTVLFEDVVLSIVPETYSEGMISWFPLFIPLCEPLFVVKGQKIVANFWRRHDSKKVWVEWQVGLASGVMTAIHNPAGRSAGITL